MESGMAEDTQNDGVEGDGNELARKKWSGKKIVMIALPVLLLLGGGGFAATKFMGGEKSEEHAEAKPGDEEVVFVDLPDMLVNLSAGDKKTSYLKLSISLEVKGVENSEAVKTKMPRVVDNFQIYLREMRLEDLRGSAGMFRLKEELLTRVNTAVMPIKVTDVLFREMLIQ
jgi:flagellar protein FliL